ncbi:MAG: hypothetical protein ACE149_20025 [Armatimonadota bacterium]
MIGDYLAQTIWRRPRTGVDGYGQPTFGAPVQTKGRWLEKRRLVCNATGEQVTSEVSATLAPDEAVAVGDQLSSDGSTYLTVIAISADRDLAGGLILKRAYL